MLIVDGHEDLAFNVLTDGRNYLQSAEMSYPNPELSVPIHRLLSDDVIKGVIAHGGIVGIMPANWAVDPTWREHRNKRDVHLSAVVDAIDVVCELAGDARHVGIGTDFDGGFGAATIPAELDTIADLPLLADALAQRGYQPEDVAGIMSGNWLRLLRGQLPDLDSGRRSEGRSPS